MEMKEIYAALEKELNKIEPAFNKAEEDFNFHMAEAEKDETIMNELRDNVSAIKKALEALGEGNFSRSVEEITEQKMLQKDEPLPITVWEKKEPKVVEKPKAWIRKKGEVWQYDPTGLVINKQTSQHSMARSLHWDASSVSRFMKLSHEAQIRKKGFYLDWGEN